MVKMKNNGFIGKVKKNKIMSHFLKKVYNPEIFLNMI